MLHRWLALRPGEGRVVAWILSLAFVLAAGRVVLLSSANAAFLSSYPAEAYGWVLIVAAAAIFTCGASYRSLLPRASFAGLAGVYLWGLAAGTAGLQALSLATQRAELSLVLAAWVLLVWVFGLLVLWSAAGRLLDGEQASRLLPVMGVGEILGDVIGGASVPGLIRLCGAEGLPYLSAAGIGLAALVLAQLRRRFPAVDGELAPGAADPAVAPALEAERPEWRPYVRRLILLCGLITICYYLVDLGYFRQVRLRYREAEAAIFLGRIYALIAGLTLFVRGFLAGRLLSRYGVRVGTRVLPVSISLVMALIAFASLSDDPELTFLAVVASAVVWRVLKDGIDKPGLLLLYQALPPGPRLRTQSLVETMTDACATALAGGLILALSGAPAFGAGGLAILTACLAAAWIWITRSLVRRHAELSAPEVEAPVPTRR